MSILETEDNLAEGKNVNVAVAAYVTAEARLKLYKYQSGMGRPFLYCNTDSVIFIQNVDKPPKLRQVIIWVTSQRNWSSLALYLSLKNFCRVDKKLCVFSFLPLDRKT